MSDTAGNVLDQITADNQLHLSSLPPKEVKNDFLDEGSKCFLDVEVYVFVCVCSCVFNCRLGVPFLGSSVFVCFMLQRSRRAAE